MQKLPLNISYKYHAIIALLIGLWLAMFLVLIAPFDAGDLNIAIRFQILPFYGVLSFTAYMLLTPIQSLLYKQYKKWTISLEFAFLLVFNIILIAFCFLYYKTDIINGTYNFQTFVLEVYLPICFIILPIIIFLRWFLNKKIPNNTQKKLILKGDNKLDVLQILPEELVCISSADNYVEVSYLKDGELHKKLLRNTLKSIQNDVENLLKVHRSHLINPIHFKEWNGSNTIVLTQMEVPVSKNYRAAILEMNQSSLKTNTLSQTQ